MHTTRSSLARLRCTLGLLGLAALVGCGGDSSGGGDDDDRPDASSAIDAGAIDGAPDAMPEKPECPVYPISWAANGGAQAAAQAELTSISPGASLTWNGGAGTPSSIFNLTLALPDCTDGTDSGPVVLAALAAHPALFQIDPAEWDAPPPYNCALVPESGQILSLRRTGLGGHEVRRDVFNYNLKRVGGEVQITAIIGTYLPPSTTAIAEQMTNCDSLTLGEARTKTFAQDLPYRVYFHCEPLAQQYYVPQPNDTIEYADAAYWTWEEGGAQSLLRGFRTVRFIVNPANYTQDLLDSDAACPVKDPESNDYTVGFTLTFDAQTGELMGITPGLDCIVC